MPHSLLRIVVGEFESDKKSHQPAYQVILKLLWRKGFAGATVFRSTEGLDAEGNLRTFILEDVQFNNLPIMIETVDKTELVESVIDDIQKHNPDGLVMIFPVTKPFEEEWIMKDYEHLALKIFIKDESKWLETPLYDQLLFLFREKKLIWSTITKAIEGFGKDHVIQKDKLFSLSSHAPVVVECIGEAKVIQEILPEIKKRVKEGLVISYPVKVM